MPTRRPSIKISALGGVVRRRSLPVGGPAWRTAGRDDGTEAGRRDAESSEALAAGAGKRDGRPSSQTAPTATRPAAVSPAHRTVDGRRRGGRAIAAWPPPR